MLARLFSSVVLAAFVVASWLPAHADDDPQVALGPDLAALPAANVVGITDGDTIRIQFDDGTIEKTRLIGIDTPEEFDPRKPVQCYAVEAADRMAALAMGRRVVVELDVTQRDRYGRLLAYLWITEDDGTTWMLNERMVAEGYAQTLTIPPNVRYVDRFLAALGLARDQGLGLWTACFQPAPVAAAVEPPPPPPTATPRPIPTQVPIPPAGSNQPPTTGGRFAPSGEWDCPSNAPIKGNRQSMIYHMPGQQAYNRTKPEDCFSNEPDAVKAGYRRALR